MSLLVSTQNLLFFKAPRSVFLHFNESKLSEMLSVLTRPHILSKITIHLSRNWFSTSTKRAREKLVILGTGWGSYSVLKNIDKSLFDVIVVSPRNHFLFTPLLPSTTVGTLEFRSIIEPVRRSGFRDDHHFQLAEAVELDTERKVVICESAVSSHRYEVDYDRLVIGVGAISNTFGIPGVRENAFFLKEIADARAIRNRILSNFELSVQPGLSEEEVRQLLHVVIVGGGPTGVEFGAEMYDFVREDAAKMFAQERDKVQVTLVEAQQILPSFDKSLRAFAEKKMSQRQQFHLVQSSVTEVQKDCVKLKDGTVIPCGLIVWSTGLSARPFTASLPLPKSSSQQLLVDEFLRVKGIPDETVFSLGDCSCIENNPHPCTAQVAERQGRYIAKSLSKYTKGKHVDVETFSWKNLGMLAYVGDYEGLSDFGSSRPKLKGFKSWVIWRSAYLTRLGSWRLRMQVPFDWMRTFFFGRDVSRF